MWYWRCVIKKKGRVLISSDKKDKSEYSIKFYIPFWRNDINIEDDLIEECDGVVGAAYMVDVGLESGMVLNY